MRQRRFYRDTKRGWIGGVCAGFANHLGIPVFWVRLLALLPMMTPLAVFVFIAYWIVVFRVPREPEGLYESPEQKEFYRAVKAEPSVTFGQVRHNLRDLEHRIRRMEAYVTSAEYQFDDLKKQR